MSAPALVTRSNGPAALFEDDRDADAYVEWMRAQTTDVFTVTIASIGPAQVADLEEERDKLSEDLAESEKDREQWRKEHEAEETRRKEAEENLKTMSARVACLRDKIEQVRASIGED